MVRTTLGHKAYYESEFGLIQFDGHVGRVYLKFHSIITIEGGGDLGKPTHTFVPCWMHEPLPPRNQCTACFTPTRGQPKHSFLLKCLKHCL